MKMLRVREKRTQPHHRRSSVYPLWVSALLVISSFPPFLSAQESDSQNISQRIEKLADAMARTRAQIEQSQHQLDEMQQELTALQSQVSHSENAIQNPPPTISASITCPPESGAISCPANPDQEDLKEREAILESQIATHDQIKVESESKYPLKITGMLLFNGFVNSGQVDLPATPTLALGGSGSTGASIKQTILGFDARGPRLFGAQSYAALRVDFDGNPQSSNSAATYSGLYGGSDSLVRLRTARAALKWDRTEAYFSLDRPIVSPDSPASLTAVAEPALAWSGHLWTWNPQLGADLELGLGSTRSLLLQGAFIDVGDAPGTSAPSSTTAASTAEQSRWPGVEARLALLGATKNESRDHLGVGGVFARHRAAFNYGFDTWAGTIDERIGLPARFELTATAYRGQALGGLGGGAYKDYVYRADPDSPGSYYYGALSDVGGWAQLKQKLSDRLEFNGAVGFDQVFAGGFRRYFVNGGTIYQNLARNRTYTGNVIFSPNSYLLFSLEYRRIGSSPVIGTGAESNVIGVAAGYKF
jgi:uncharacterized coiled-coil protein SlyX